MEENIFAAYAYFINELDQSIQTHFDEFINLSVSWG